MNRTEDSYEAYQQRRARDKYDGKVGKDFPLREFRNAVDYLASVLEGAVFDAEDLSDMARAAISTRRKSSSVLASEARSKLVIV